MKDFIFTNIEGVRKSILAAMALENKEEQKEAIENSIIVRFTNKGTTFYSISVKNENEVIFQEIK